MGFWARLEGEYEGTIWESLVSIFDSSTYVSHSQYSLHKSMDRGSLSILNQITRGTPMSTVKGPLMPTWTVAHVNPQNRILEAKLMPINPES